MPNNGSMQDLPFRNTFWHYKSIKKKQLASIEINFFRRTAGHSLFDHKGNE
jgi:hypothetical protein